MIKNDYCVKCLKSEICMWWDKLSKLKGTDKNPINLHITVDGCDEYFESIQSEQE